MSDYEGPTWFSEATEDQVRSLLADIDCVDDALVETVLSWAKGAWKWYAVNHVLVGWFHENAQKARAKGDC